MRSTGTPERPQRSRSHATVPSPRYAEARNSSREPGTASSTDVQAAMTSSVIFACRLKDPNVTKPFARRGDSEGCGGTSGLYTNRQFGSQTIRSRKCSASNAGVCTGSAEE